MPKKSNATPESTDQLSAEQLANIVRQLESLVVSSRRVEDYLRIMAEPVLHAALPHIFKNGKQTRAYELSDGMTSTRQIGAAVGVDQKTISTWWRVWEKDFGIVEKVGKRGQFRHRYSLQQLVSKYSQSDGPDGVNAANTDAEE